MPDKEKELIDLAEADRHIMESQQRIDTLQDRIERLRSRGMDTGAGEQLLATIQETLTAMMDHRRLILERIANVE